MIIDVRPDHGDIDPVALAAQIHEALAADEFRLLYAPKLSLSTNLIVGVEAQLRWDHPRHGLLGPEQFIGPATPSDLVASVGTWGMREACRRAAAWSRSSPRTPVTVSIDVPTAQFHGNFADTVAVAVTDAGIAPAAVSLELSEQTLSVDTDETTRILGELRAVGVSVSIDHFGSGYSSLDSLTRMDVSAIKIPPSFMSGSAAAANDTAMVASVIGLAHAMGLEVIAEDVESAEQLETLRNLGCDAAQGPCVGVLVTAAEMDQNLAATAAGPALSARVCRPQSSPAAATVLVVDDCEGSRILSATSLLSAGFAVEASVAGREALAKAQQLRPDCVLLDVELPDMSGIDVCKALRAHPDTTECTIVMLSIHDDRASKAESFLLGADDYVIKPASPRELVGRVSAAIRRRAAACATTTARADPALLDMLHGVRDRSLRGAMAELEPLSTRQLEILKRLLDGDRVPAIARDLYVSASTVRNHLSSIFRKLGVHSQEELLALLRSMQVAQEEMLVPDGPTAAPSPAGVATSDRAVPVRG